MSALGFCLSYLIPLSVVVGYYLGGVFTFLTPFSLFVVVPILDWIIGTDPRNPTEEHVEELEQSRTFRWITFLYVPVQLALLIWGARVIAARALSAVELVGFVLSIGVTAGAVGITIGHELSHRPRRLERVLGRILLMTVCYMHFFIEHNWGHHFRVATPGDPATARYGESFYRFFPRTLIGSFRSAWQLESRRVRRAGKAIWSLNNQMIVFLALPVLFAAGLGALFGWRAVLFFVAQSIVAFTLLEIVNYLEHYGLERKELSSSHYEQVTEAHSWNSNHRLTNYFLFKLQRHSDHHVHPLRRYQVLQSVDRSPQLPTGYAGMVLLALLPPLWRRVMHPRIQRMRAGRN